MRNLEAIESELSSAREALSNVKGTPAEVYSRIVGYYRSVRNWNRGKREEYGQRLVFKPDASLLASCRVEKAAGLAADAETAGNAVPSGGEIRRTAEGVAKGGAEERVLLFVRPACPACPSAKDAAGRLGLPLELYDADTDEGLAEAVKRRVMSTPTAILLSSGGEELRRARDPAAIGKLLETEPLAV